MGRRWRRRPPEEPARRLAAWWASGLPAAVFGVPHDVSVDSLQRWRREAGGGGLRRRRRASSPVLVPVHVRPGPSAALKIDWGDGRRVRYSADAPAATVTALVDVRGAA